MQPSIIHLPNQLHGTEKAPPQEVKLTRDIMPQEALQMIATQQGKIVRLLMHLNNVANEMHKAQERATKATNIAARHAAKSKHMEDELFLAYCALSAERDRTNQLEDNVTMMGRVIAVLVRSLTEFTDPEMPPRAFIGAEFLKQDGRVVEFTKNPEGTLMIEVVKGDPDQSMGASDGGGQGLPPALRGVRLPNFPAAEAASGQVVSNEAQDPQV